MKGQFTLEYIGAAVFFLLTVVGVAAMGANKIPKFQEDMKTSSLNMEAREVTERMLSSPGYHDYGSGGTDWERNVATISHTTEFGLASDYLVVEKDKLENLSYTGADQFNYTQFKRVAEVEHNYLFNFTWMPVVETPRSFIRGSPKGPVGTEPTSASYPTANNRVHYGTLYIFNREYKFLVTAHDGVYDTLYYSGDWNFDDNIPYSRGEKISLRGREFRITKFENRGDTPGTSVILSRHVKTFGGSIDQDSRVIKLNRYAVLNARNSDPQPLRIEVLAW
ncbi:MAG: hypothetical protein ABEJ69_03185 [Candidatus Nanohaloarchaea archaeon]